MRRSDLSVLFVATLLISLLASFLIVTTAREAEIIKEPEFPNFRFLFDNYRVLREFLQLPETSKTDAFEELDPDSGMVSYHPLIADLLRLQKAGDLLTEKKYSQLTELLQKEESAYPFVNAQKELLALEVDYFSGNYTDYMRLFPHVKKPSLNQSLFMLNCYVKTKETQKAFALFKQLFAQNKIKPLEDYLGRKTLTGFLQRLEIDDWLQKFKFLVEHNMYSEFIQEKKYMPLRAPQLVNLIYGEFSYNRKKYTQCKKYLALVKDDWLVLYKKRLLLKIKLRDKQYDGINEALDEFKDHNEIYPDILLNSASLLLVNGESAPALEIFNRYLKRIDHIRSLCFVVTGMEPIKLRGDDYWKAVWICAWLSYQKKDRAAAIAYFSRCTDARIQSYRIAGTYWLQRLKKIEPEKKEFMRYPFSYYYAREMGLNPPSKQSLEPFIALLNRPRGPRFNEIVDNLRTLVKFNLMPQAVQFIRWSVKNETLTIGDKHTLMLIESILWLKRGNLAMAFIRFRDNFECYRCLRLPRFLRDLVVPIKYGSLVEEYSTRNNLDSALVYSLIREESYFRPGVVSYADAYGLMQLLLKTARAVAYSEDRKVFRADLFKPDVNIKYGTHYLKFLLDKYDGRVYLALAAYNAGDHRVDQWLKQFPDVGKDEFIEMIPFTATRSYVKNILRNYYYYTFYYGQNNDG